MRVTGLVAGSVLIALTAVGAHAQELDSTLAYINRTLAERQFSDDQGQTTYSEVQFTKGTLVVRINRTKAGNRFTNVYEVPLENVNAGGVVAHDRGGFLSISLGATGPVTERMDCLMAGGARTAWDLPDRKNVWVELARKSPEERELVRALSEVLTLAKSDPRYAGS